MNDNYYLRKCGAGAEPCAPTYGIWSLQDSAGALRANDGRNGPALWRGAERYRFARQCLYRLIVSRLARAGVIMSGALTSIDVL